MREKTKITQILLDKGLSQIDFQALITDKTGSTIGRDRISRICTGKIRKYKLETAIKISDSLGITIDSFIEDDSPIYNMKKIFENPVYFKQK